MDIMNVADLLKKAMREIEEKYNVTIFIEDGHMGIADDEGELIVR